MCANVQLLEALGFLQRTVHIARCWFQDTGASGEPEATLS
jgi:hypothetical protein